MKNKKIEQIIESEIKMLLEDPARSNFYKQVGRQTCGKRLGLGGPCNDEQYQQYVSDRADKIPLLGPIRSTVRKWYNMGELAPSDFDTIL